MFSKYTSLKKVNINKFNTSNVLIMSYMLADSIAIEKLNLKNFNTNKVNDVGFFNRCYSLKELNLDYFNDKNVKKRESTFIYPQESQNSIKFKYNSFRNKPFYKY